MDQPGEFASQDLVKALYQYELTETFAGRTMLLDGLPAEIELKREPDNRKIDLMIIIGRLRQLERLPTGEWPITKLINNAIKYGPSAPVKETLVEILKCIG